MDNVSFNEYTSKAIVANPKGSFEMVPTFDRVFFHACNHSTSMFIFFIKIGFNSYNLAKYVRKDIICGLLFDIMLKSTCHSEICFANVLGIASIGNSRTFSLESIFNK